MNEVTRQDFERLENKVDEIAQALAGLEALQRTESERCPYRETLARTSNGLGHLARLEERVERQGEAIQSLELSWAKLVALMVGSGVLGGALSGPLAGLLAALGR